jgi:hypothetical protein
MTIAYITLAEALQAFPPSYNNNDDVTINQLILSASDFVDNYCNRSSGGFSVQTYDELYHGTGTNLMYLNNCPLVSVQRVATTELPACYVRNNNNDMGVRALVQVTATGVTLTYIESAVTTTNTYAFATYPTVTQLVAAINGAGNHWQAGVMGGFGTWASADLRATQGNYGSRITTSYLWIHWYELPTFRVYEPSSEVYSTMGFARGVFNWRCQYTAGYATLPNDLRQAIAELVYATYMARFINPNVQSVNLGGYSYSQLADKSFNGLSAQSKKTLGQYRRHPVRKFSTW